jgi:EmrB/QacA subfamily drug resistance transporter
MRSRADRDLRLTLAGVMLAVLLAVLDNTIVGTAMPTIVRNIGGLGHASWVVVAYTLTIAITAPVWGKAGDLYGRKPVFLLAICVFLVGSGLSGAAGSMSALIAFRAVQGVGAGGLSTGAFAVIGELVPPRERGRYQGMMASVVVLGTIGGPLVGGAVVSGLGWRWAFYVNIPLGLLALAWSQWRLRLTTRRGLTSARAAISVDWRGSALIAVTISAVVLTATWGGTRYQWVSWQLGLLAAAAIAGLAGFVMVERRTAEPLLPPRVFGNRNFRLTVVITFVTGPAFYGGSLYFPLFQQVVQGQTAISSGLLLLPMMVPIVAMSQLSGKVISRTGRYTIFPVLGAALLTAGMLLWATVSTGTPLLATAAYMIVVGAGLGFLLQLTTTIAQNSVGMSDIGVASASVTLFRTLGGALGVAVFGTLLGRTSTAFAGTTWATGPVATAGYRHAIASGMDRIGLAAGIVCAAGLLAALLIEKVPLRGKAAALPPTREPSALDAESGSPSA